MNTDWLEILDVIIRAVLSLITLFLVTKMLGKKQVSELSLFDYVIGISIGNFAAEMTINTDSQYMNGIVAVLMFGIVAYAISILTMKSIKLRRYFMGVPTILIEKGILIEKSLKEVKFDINDLLQECRRSGYFDISQIEYAIMEANGQISFLPKAEYKNVTIQDLKIKTIQEGICANIVIDGKIMHENLKNMNKDEIWLDKELKIKGQKIEDILLCTLDMNDKLKIYEKNKSQKYGDVLE